MNPFDAWAEIYDSVYSYVTSDIPFYVEQAKESKGPVLELGCGTGRIAVPISRAGISIVGIDSSLEMLKVARRKLAQEKKAVRDRLTLRRGDMRTFRLPQRFLLVIIPFRGFLCLLTVQDQIRTLKNIRRHLEPGGRLAFNIFVPDLNMLVDEGDVPYHFRDVTDPATGRKLVIYHQSSNDNFSQITSTRIIIEELGESGAVARKLYRDFQLRYAHRWEMQHLLELCGFEIEALYGDFDGSPFDGSSTEMVWTARRPLR